MQLADKNTYLNLCLLITIKTYQLYYNAHRVVPDVLSDHFARYIGHEPSRNPSGINAIMSGKRLSKENIQVPYCNK